MPTALTSASGQVKAARAWAASSSVGRPAAAGASRYTANMINWMPAANAARMPSAMRIIGWRINFWISIDRIWPNIRPPVLFFRRLSLGGQLHKERLEVWADIDHLMREDVVRCQAADDLLAADTPHRERLSVRADIRGAGQPGQQRRRAVWPVDAHLHLRLAERMP